MGRDNVDCVYHPGRRCTMVEVLTHYPLCASCWEKSRLAGRLSWPAAILRAGVVRPEKLGADSEDRG